MKQKFMSVLFVLVVATVTGFGIKNASDSAGQAAGTSKITLIAPAAPGGGWDGFARESQQAIRHNGIINNAQVVNIPGAGGTIGLSRLVQMGGQQDVLMVSGGVMIGAIELSKASESLAETTPIARLADDYNVLVVPASSPHQTMADLVAAWQENPGSTAIAGGSLGSIDHILTGLLAQEIGVDPQHVNYIAYSGGGEVLTSLLSNTAVAGISGFNDFKDQIESGNLRALAVSSAEPLPGIDIPTFIESGLDVSMSNWRGYVAPPGISDEAKDHLISIVTEFRDTPEWQDALQRNNWTDSFLVGPELDKYISDESARIGQIITDLGL